WLDDHRLAKAVGGNVVVWPEAMRARSACRHRRLDHQPVALEAPPRLLEVGIAASFDSQRRHGRNAAVGELGKIGLVAVPAEQRWRIEHSPMLRLGAVEHRKPAR